MPYENYLASLNCFLLLAKPYHMDLFILFIAAVELGGPKKNFNIKVKLK